MTTPFATPASMSSYRNCPVSELSSRTSSAKSRKTGAKSTASSSSAGDDHDESHFTRAQHWVQARQEWLLAYTCIVSMILSIAFYGASFANSDTMIVSNVGDGQNIAYSILGYKQLCFIPQVLGPDNSTYNSLPWECTVNGIDHNCNFALSPFAQGFQSDYYNGRVDSQLSNCAEFNAYRAFHVMGFVFAPITLIFMILGAINFSFFRIRGYSHYIKASALICSFCSGGFGVAAQCLLVDWMNLNQKNLVVLAYEPYVSGVANTISTVVLGQSSFYEVGGWVCAMGAFVLYIAHFPSALAK